VAEHDVVVIGSGHNGLIAAAYMAKAGLDVCVVEKNDIIGGGTVTVDGPVKGWRHDLASMAHQFLQFNPLLMGDELGLVSKYGLEYVNYDGPQMAILFEDGRSLVVYKDIDATCAQIEQFSKKDADVYHKWYEISSKHFEMLKAGATSPSPAFGEFVSFLDDTVEGQETLRTLFDDAVSIVNRTFESSQVKTYLARYTSEAMVIPFEKGTGTYLNMMIPSTHNYGMAVPKGGSGELPRALAEALAAFGGTIRTSCPVVRVKISGGKATGVVLASGEEITAKRAVINACSVQQLFNVFMDPGEPALPAGFQDVVAALEPSVLGAFKYHFALKEPPRWKAAQSNPDVDKCVLVDYDAPWDQHMHQYLEYMLGNPVTDMFAFSTFTLADPGTRCPDGAAVSEIYHFAPTKLKGGVQRWKEIGQESADAMLAFAQKHALNLDDNNILGKFFMTPLDIQEYDNAMRWGDIMHIGSQTSQFYGNRPVPGWSKYKTPVENLYMVGASTPPGGGVGGGARAAMPLIMKYMGMDFDDVVK
jgi:phytoene dehydrogenase-like protein